MKPIHRPGFRNGAILILLSVLTASVFAADLSGTPDQSGTPDLSGTPEHLVRYGEPINLIYQPADGAGVISVVAKINVNHDVEPTYLNLVPIDGVWETVYSVKDTTVRAFQVQFLVNGMRDSTSDDPKRVHWFMMTGSDGRPVRGAYETLALLRAESKSLSPELLAAAERDVHLELEAYPDNWSCRMLLYSLWMRKDEGNAQAEYRIRKDVDSVLTAFGENAETLVFASEALRRSGGEGGAEQMTRRLIQIDPNGAAGLSARLDSILALENPSERMIHIEKWLRSAPDSPLVWRAWEALGSAAISLDDSVRMAVVADTLIRSPLPQSAASLAALAGGMMEKGYRLDLAEACARHSLDLFDHADSTQSPPGVAMDDWIEQRRLTRARVAGTLGWIFHLRGDIDSAVRYLEYASQNLLEPGVFSRMAQAYERTSTPARALLFYARVVAFGGEAGEEARQSFNALWTRLGLNAEDMRGLLTEQSDWVETEYRQKILGREMDKTAPDLNLRDLNGHPVRLSDQQGVIVLCFWATWSRSSLKMLDELQILAESKGDVLFLTVALDRESDAVYNFISDRKIGLPVLLDDGSSENYSLEGVPTVLVLDAKQVIRFEHRGYRPDIRNLLITEIESLILRKTY